MVHLATVTNDQPPTEDLASLRLYSEAEEQDGQVSVYGSKFAAECLPRHEMPEKEMPNHVAYRMIKDDLSLDGNPVLNLASFVTTYMVGHTSRQSQSFHEIRAKDAHRKRRRKSLWLKHCPRISLTTKNTLKRQIFRIAA